MMLPDKQRVSFTNTNAKTNMNTSTAAYSIFAFACGIISARWAMYLGFPVLAVELTSCSAPLWPQHRETSVIREYLLREDYSKMNEEFSRVDSLAKSRLRIGMSASQVRGIMGRAHCVVVLDERAKMWSYAPSISGTFEYWIVLVDDKLDFFGEAQTTWLWERYGSNFGKF